MTSRQRQAQGLPPAGLEQFPAHEVTSSTDLFRAHLARLGPWWFGNDGGGRFDLLPPDGTCYLALDAESAVRERLGPVLGARSALPGSALADVVVSRLRLPGPRRLANLQSRAAAPYGVTRELETMVPYAVPQAWARAFAGAGLDGVRYGPRFTPGDSTAVALFGPAGLATWDTDDSPLPAAQACPELVTWAVPRRADVTVVRPPRTRAVR